MATAGVLATGPNLAERLANKPTGSCAIHGTWTIQHTIAQGDKALNLQAFGGTLQKEKKLPIS
jgi:hypothetical protein